MAVSNNTINTRIQLKRDVEDNWKKLGTDSLSPFTPMPGEIIVYLPDNNHDYSRIKIGDGTTNINTLSFVDAGSINGATTLLSEYNNYNTFPQIGSENKLYIDLSTNNLYYYDSTYGYTLLFNLVQTSIRQVAYWSPGKASSATIENHILKIENSNIPELITQNTNVVSSLRMGGNNR